VIVRRDPDQEAGHVVGVTPRSFGPAFDSAGAIWHAGHSPALPRALCHPWWVYVAVVGGIFFLATFYVGGGFPNEFFLRPLSLSTEQGVGTWWSGFQFVLFALMAQSLAIRFQPMSPQLSRGFTLLALIGLLLFVDEMGSVHERVHRFIPLPGDLALLPLAAGGAALLGTSLWLLIRRRDIVGRAPWMIATAFFLFGCVYVLEFVEHRMVWDVAVWRGLRFAVEEGLELVGAMLLIGSMVHVGQAKNRGRRADPTALMPTAQALLWLARLSLYAAIPVWLLRAGLTAEKLTLPVKGDFGVLIPIALLIVAALFALRHGLSQVEDRVAWWSLAGLLLVASIDLECHFHHYLFHGDADLRWRSDLGLLWSTPLLMWGSLSIPELRTRTALTGLTASYALVVTSVVVGAAALALATPYVVAFVMVYLVSHGRVASGEDESQLLRPDEPIPAE
jgi:hypothetical protein